MEENIAPEKYINENKSMTFIVAVWCNTERWRVRRKYKKEAKKQNRHSLTIKWRKTHRRCCWFCIFPIWALDLSELTWLDLRRNRNNATIVFTRHCIPNTLWTVRCVSIQCETFLFGSKSHIYTWIAPENNYLTIFFSVS